MALKYVDVTKARKRTICIYGGNGGGKTHLAMTAPGKKLLFDYYGNIETCLKFPRSEYEVLEALGYNDFMSAIKDPDIGMFPVIILDNLTGMNRHFVKESQNSGKMGGHVAELPNQGDYSLSSERLRLVVTALHNAAKEGKFHVILIAHEQVKEIRDADGNVTSTNCGPSLPGQVPAHILSLSAELLYLTADAGGNRYAHLMSRGQWPAATRLLDPKQAIKNPNLTEMYKGYW